MKGKMNKRLLSLVVMVCMMILSAMPVFAAKDKVLTEDEISMYKQYAAQLIEDTVNLTDEDIAKYLESDDNFTVAAITSWNNAREELGALVQVDSQTVETDGSDVVVTSEVTFELKTASVEWIVDSKEGTGISLAFNINYTMGEKMQQAGLNTVMGIGIVFLVLLFLSFLIGQFKHIGKLENAAGGKKAAAPAPVKPAPVVEPVVEEEEELANDEELVAVIAAAIAAYEGSESTDGFVVRSIRKAGSRNWKRA